MTTSEVLEKILKPEEGERKVQVGQLLSTKERGVNPEYLKARQSGITGKITVPAMGPSIWNGHIPSEEPMVWVRHEDGNMALYYPAELVPI